MSDIDDNDPNLRDGMTLEEAHLVSEHQETAELLRRLDAWTPDKNPGPLIRWAAAHLRGCDR